MNVLVEFPELLGVLERLASTPFTASALRALAPSIPWPIDEDLSDLVAADEKLCLWFRPRPPLALLLLVGEERTAGFALGALTEDPDEPGFHFSTWREYHECFDSSLAILSRSLGAPAEQGSAVSPDSEEAHRHALWKGSHSWIILVEHHEGDGHFGHDATVDVRIVPGSERPTLPLRTNVLF